MNILDVEASLPNGFHDAVLESISVDYPRSVAEIRLQIWVDLLPAQGNEGRSPVMRRARVQFADVSYCAIGMPREVMEADGGVSVVGEKLTAEIAGESLPQVPKTTVAYSFYAVDWCTRISVASREAQLEWLETDESAWSRARERDRLRHSGA